jgi:hypothetical protein
MVFVCISLFIRSGMLNCLTFSSDRVEAWQRLRTGMTRHNYGRRWWLEIWNPWTLHSYNFITLTETLA